MRAGGAPLVSVPVGVIVERRKAQSQWADYIWRATAVIPGQPSAEPWTVLSENGDITTFYAGPSTIDLYRSETTYYRCNLASGALGLWVVMTARESDPPYRVAAVTADPAEGEGFTEIATNLVEQVPMPDVIRVTIAAFIDEYHVEREFFKRKRDRATPQALARQDPAAAKSSELYRRAYGDHDE